MINWGRKRYGDWVPRGNQSEALDRPDRVLQFYGSRQCGATETLLAWVAIRAIEDERTGRKGVTLFCTSAEQCRPSARRLAEIAGKMTGEPNMICRGSNDLVSIGLGQLIKFHDQRADFRGQQPDRLAVEGWYGNSWWPNITVRSDGMEVRATGGGYFMNSFRLESSSL